MKTVCTALLEAVQMPSEIGAAWIQAIGTLLAALLAVWGIGFQIRAQARLSREAIAETEARKIKAQMYEDGVRITGLVRDCAIDLSTKLRRLEIDFSMEINSALGGPDVPPPSLSYGDLLDMHSELSDNCLSLIFLIEARRVINPKIVIFRDCISSRLYDLSDVFTKRFPESVMKALPTSVGGQVFRVPFAQALWEESITSIKATEDSINDIIMYLEDFNVEMQNLLLADIFGNKVDHRQPEDPSRMVASIDNIAALEKSLEATAWGQMCQNALEKERARQRMLQGQDAADLE